MRPDQAALFQVMQEKIKSGPDDQIIDLPEGARVRVRRAPEPGVLARVESLETHAEVHSTMWAPCGTRPAGFPDDLPFLPGKACSFSAVNGNRTVQWHGAEEGDIARVASDLARDGWVETTIPSPSMPGMVIRPFRREARQRIVLLGGSLLSVLETRAE